MRRQRTPYVNDLVEWDIHLPEFGHFVGSARKRRGVVKTAIGPLHLVAIADKLNRKLPEADTFFLSNRNEGTGVARWYAGRVASSTLEMDMGTQGAMVPRGALVDSALTLEHWRGLPDNPHIPEWVRERALHEALASVANHIGPYKFYVNESDPSAPGGRAVASHHGGPGDWAKEFAEGRFMRFKQMIGAMSRPIHLNWEPGAHGRYWWDASAVGYAIPGYRWIPDHSGWCPYEPQLAAQPITDRSHGRRWHGAPGALASFCRAARYASVEVCWPEIRRAFTMDRTVPPTDLTHNNDDLYSPLHQILGLLPSVSWGNRSEAEAIEVFATAASYLPFRERDIYKKAWSTFLARQVNRYGCADFAYNGDAASFGLPAPAALAFQQQKLYAACISLNTRESRAAAARIKRFWTVQPPYCAHTGGRFETAWEAPHSEELAVPEYAHWTHPETVDFPQVVATTLWRIQNQGGGFGECPLDTVPPIARRWHLV